MYTLVEIQTALAQMWEEFKGLRNREVIREIEYLAEYSDYEFLEILEIYNTSDFYLIEL